MHEAPFFILRHVGDNAGFWLAVAGVGEMLWLPAVLLMIYQGFKERSAGMSYIGISGIFAQCVLYGFVGPFVAPDLFPHHPTPVLSPPAPAEASLLDADQVAAVTRAREAVLALTSQGIDADGDVPEAVATALADLDSEIRAAAASLRSQQTREGAGSAILERLAEPLPELRGEAVAVVGEQSDTGLITHLMAAIAHPDAAVRRVVVSAFVHVHDPEVIPRLQQIASTDPDTLVRRSAQRALKRMGAPPPGAGDAKKMEKRDWWAIQMWRMYALLMGVMLYQYVRYQRTIPSILPSLERYFYVAAVLVLVLQLVGQWSAITFFRDYNVNISDGCVMVMVAASYVLSGLIRPHLRGLSVTVAVLQMLGMLLLCASVWPLMDTAFPGHDDTGYAFIYLSQAMMLVSYTVYIAILIHRRRHEAAAAPA